MMACSAWARKGCLAAVLGGAALVVGCTAETSSGSTIANAGGSGPVGGGGGSGSGPQQPMVVVVDTNQTIDADPGEGVAVLAEYQQGGHWQVRWMCGTNKTGLPCHFDVSASVASGTITNPAGLTLASARSLTQPSAQSVESTTTTTTAADGFTFDAPAGATITVDAQIEGQRDGSWLFFVQDGKVNGGYGAVTDPLLLEPASP